MKESLFLNTIQQILKMEQFESAIESDTNTPPFGRVIVVLGNDHLERERILEITTQTQDLGESLKDPPEIPKYIRIQFEVPMPFDFKDHSAAEIASLIAFLNRMLELPGFEIDEVNSGIYYRYVLLTSDHRLDKDLITGIIRVIIRLCEMFSDTIEQVSEGKCTFNDLVEHMLQSTEPLSE